MRREAEKFGVYPFIGVDGLIGIFERDFHYE